jgi:hypothetical protein
MKVPNQTIQLPICWYVFGAMGWMLFNKWKTLLPFFILGVLALLISIIILVCNISWNLNGKSSERDKSTCEDETILETGNIEL